MTDLNRPIARRAVRASMPYKSKPKRIVVLLMPGDVIGMRLERTRKTYTAEIKTMYWQLVRWHADAELARRKAERKAKKNGGVA